MLPVEPTKRLPFHLLIEELENTHFQEFSRQPLWSQDGIKCDCAGLITLLLKRTGNDPGPLKRAQDYYDYFLKKSPKTNVTELKRYDVLAWKKENSPKSGDTGHMLIITRDPKKTDDSQYMIEAIEVNRFQGLIKRALKLTTHKDGRLKGIQWHPEKKKVKETQIVGLSLFKENLCDHCHQPQTVCLCSYLPFPKGASPNYVILRHPDEKVHALGTVKLLELYYHNLSVIDATIFPEHTGVLVYPQTPQEPAQMIDQLPQDQPLIFIDATWKKSYRMLQENPWLKKLPRYEIKKAKSHYTLRRPPSQGSLNTLESFSYCLERKYPQQANDLRLIFEKFIEGKITYVGQEKLDTYYKNRL